ncbi:pickpocket protein 19-like [Musca vetustissima]|uniref:pickpocket protein 19-like n=1 Tax=Musca vetustissima TaxID=27455 RepID=UPI002AB619A9|nr:pickpocket protein 19-like [Musca vetustissima]
MYYPNELVYFKKTNFNHPQGLLIFKEAPEPESPTPAEKQVQIRLTHRLLKFCQNTIHGVNHIWEPHTKPAVRIFWCLIVTTALIGCILLYNTVTQRHREEVLVTVVETSHLPIYEIPFPAVAICPVNHINWMRYKAAEARFLPRYAAKEAKAAFYNLMVLLDRMTFTRLSSIDEFLKTENIPRSVENIVLSDVAKFMALRCDEIFIWCNFDNTQHDCCKIFVPEYTGRGPCLVFNSVISKESRIKQLTDNFYPWRARYGGEGSGLSFRLRYNSSLVRPGTTIPFAFTVFVKEADEWSDTLFHILQKNTHNSLMVTPIITETSRNTRHIAPAKRKCVFSDEITKYDQIDGLGFHKYNCLVRCEEKFLLNTCNCTTSMFFPGIPNQPHKECKVSDLQCMYDHRDIFNYLKEPNQDEYINDTRRGMSCDCLNNCESLLFLVKLNVLPLPNPNDTVPVISGEVYFGKNTMTKYSSRLQYTYLDLISNFGGILGLFLGASVLSIVEIVHFFSRFMHLP